MFNGRETAPSIATYAMMAKDGLQPMAKPNDKELATPKKTGLSGVVKRILGKRGDLAETLAQDVLEQRQRVKKRIERTRQEIEDGARPKEGRFRL